ncbi:MAG: PKD domain-containing protein [Thermodesulfobacteriota bacterium]
MLFLFVVLAASPVLAQGWTSTDPLLTQRRLQAAVLLPSGRVLVAGGQYYGGTVLTSAEIYDPGAPVGQKWSQAAPMPLAHRRHGILLTKPSPLAGKVLVVGEDIIPRTPTAYLFDENAGPQGAWTSTGNSPSIRRFGAALIELPDGKILYPGGYGGQGGCTQTFSETYSTAELFDPVTNMWSPTGSLASARLGFTATLLTVGPNAGKVLVAGGAIRFVSCVPHFIHNTTEIYDPATGTWSPAASMNLPRSSHTATLLPDGRVLVAGGFTTSLAITATAEIYDPNTDTWTYTTSMAAGVRNHKATKLLGGCVLVAGQYPATTGAMEIFDPFTEQWLDAGLMVTPRFHHTATLLPSDEVLVTGGIDGNNNLLANSELFHNTVCPANQPPIADAGADQNRFLTETVNLDGSLSSDPDGDAIVSYTWAIDSAPAGSLAVLTGANTATPSITPDLMGEYIISLVVNDGTDNSAADTVIINVTENMPPVAVATGTPATGVYPLTVVFDASQSSDPEGGPLTYFWVFGDGGTSIEAVPGHTYATVGTYTAIVTVTDDFGLTDQASVTIVVTAPNQPPTVGPTASPYNGLSPLDVQFTANASDPEGDPLTYFWDLGDGATSTEANPLHTYGAPGTYLATVTVSDGEFSATGSVTISVGSPLACNVTEAKADEGKKGKVKGKVNFKADFTYIGLPALSDLIEVTFDGITLISEPFAAFTEEADEPGEFKFKDKNLHMKIDFTKKTIKVSRHKMLLGDVDNSNGVDIVISFGDVACTDHFVMKEHDEEHDGDHEKKMSHKEKDRDGE